MKLATFRFWRAVTISAFVVGFCGQGLRPAAAQEAESPAAEQPSSPGGKTKADKKAAKPEAAGKSAKSGAKSANAKPKAGRFASEAQAKAKCPGAVVWVGKDGLNHYEGSREYGLKPGAYACEE